MNSNRTAPVLAYHNRSQPIGTASTSKRADGALEVTVNLNPTDLRLARRIARKQYGHIASPLFKAMNAGRYREEARKRHERWALTGGIILFIVLWSSCWYLYGQEHMRAQLRPFIERY